MIAGNVDTGSSTTLDLRTVVLVYESASHGEPKRFIEIRPVVGGPDGPEYGPGRPATPRRLRRVLESGEPDAIRMIDPRLLATGEAEAAWYSPPARRTPIFTGAVMEPVSGVAVAMPGLVFHVRHRVLRVRAVRARARPRSGTALSVAPVWNVYRHGGLCMGSMPVPRGHPADSMKAWETAFWDSAFTVCHDPRSCGRPGGYLAMLRELRALDRFPGEWLTPSNETLEQWLRAK